MAAPRDSNRAAMIGEALAFLLAIKRDERVTSRPAELLRPDSTPGGPSGS